MQFKQHSMYKNVYTSPDAAFIVDEIIKQDKNGADMVVTWYKLTQDGRYVSIGHSGEFYVAKSQSMYYLQV